MKLRAANVSGHSMRPVLEPGDVVVYQPIDRWRAGDVVVVRDMVHRLIWVDPWGGLWHAGDHPAGRAGRCRRADAHGRVIGIVRGASWEDVPPSPRSRWRQALEIGRHAAAMSWRRARRLAGRMPQGTQKAAE